MKKSSVFLAALMLAACSGVDSLPETLPEAAAVSGTPLFALTDPSSAPLQPVGMSIPVPCTVTAGFDGTRTHLETDGALSHVLWSSGDGFDGFWFDGSVSSYSYTSYTTSGSGPVADFSGDSMPDGVRYYIYPGVPTLEQGGYTYLKFGIYNSQAFFGVEVPSEQHAVPGDIEDGVNVAYAYSPTKDGHITFHNFTSLLRFRMSGSVVSSLANIKLKGQSQLAGNICINGTDNAPASIMSGVMFPGDVHSTTITLTGSFQEGQDYYIALIPSTQRIQLVFEDASGNTTTKVSGRDITFGQGRIVDIGTVSLGSALEDGKPKDPVLYMSASSGYTPVSIAVIPEAFRESEMSDYEVRARAAVDAIMATEPYKSYKSYFNVWILYTNSKDSGASVTDGNGTVTELHNTPFGAKWGAGSNYGDMVANGDAVYDFVTENCPDIKNGLHTIEEVPVLMIINDTRFGGVCHSNSIGMGYAMVPYSHSGDPIYWSFPEYTAASDSDPSAGYRKTTQQERQEIGSCAGDGAEHRHT